MADTVGRSIIEVGVDASQLETGMAKAVKTVEGFEQAATDAAKGVGGAMKDIPKEVEGANQKLDATAKRLLASLERESQAAGRSRSEYLELRAAKMGVSEQAAPYIARLREQEVAAKAAAVAEKQATEAAREAARAKRDGATAFNAYGMSAKQTTAALRQVPAQLTDIVVSLQGGQAPLTVLLQQGGQLKDVFGGVVPALRGLASGITSLINPYTLAATAVGGLALAYYKGSQQANAYFNAVNSAGGAAGFSAAGVAQLADQVGKVTGKYGDARDAAVALAETGTIGGNNLAIALRGVVAGTEVTGRSIKELVSDFSNLGKEPVDALVKLNEKYNFLTAEIYNNITALQSQGRTQEATTAAFNAFADAMERRKGEIVDNAGIFERAWRGVKREIEAAGATFASIGAPSTDSTALAQARRNLESYRQSAGPRGAAPGTRLAALIAETEQEITIIERRIGAQNRLAESQMRQAQALKDAFAAEGSISKIRDEGATNTQKMNKALGDYRKKLDEIRAANPASVELDPKNIAATEAAIRNRFKETPRKPKEYQEEAAVRLLGTLREQEAALRAQLDQTDKLTASQQVLAKFNQEIADIKGKKILTADQKSLLANEDKLRAQLEVNVAVQNEVVARDAATKELEKQQRLQDQLNERARQLAQTITDANAARATTGEENLAVFGRGDRAREQLNAQQKIEAEFRRYQEQLNRATPASLLGSDKYKEAVAEIQSGLSQALALHNEYYAQLRARESNWQNGLSKATENYVDNASKTAKQTEELVSGAFKGMEDALVQFVMTGKLSFDQLAGFIVASITRIIIQQQISNAIGLAGSGGGGGSGIMGFASTLFGALVGGGSGTLAPVEDLGTYLPRAAGGPVNANGMYEVNENMPELLNFKGRQFLMMGGESGQVSNLKEGSKIGGGRPIIVNVSAVQGMNRDTALQQGNRIGQGIKNAMGRNN